jgi:hypothetical protein
MDLLPHAQAVRDRLTDCLRETHLLRKILRVAERADYYRECDRRAKARREGTRDSAGEEVRRAE